MIYHYTPIRMAIILFERQGQMLKRLWKIVDLEGFSGGNVKWHNHSGTQSDNCL